jgi:hypothetical protein
MTLTATTDAEAYWHGYRGGWRGPGWGGCWRCGPGWVGPAAVVAGAEVVEGATAPPVVVEQAPPPVYVQQPSQVVAAPGPTAPVGGYSIPPVGSTYPNLLPGCFLAPRNGINFYQCQGFRMRPLYGGNSFYYRVVPG